MKVYIGSLLMTILVLAEQRACHFTEEEKMQFRKDMKDYLYGEQGDPHETIVSIYESPPSDQPNTGLCPLNQSLIDENQRLQSRLDEMKAQLNAIKSTEDDGCDGRVPITFKRLMIGLLDKISIKSDTELDPIQSTDPLIHIKTFIYLNHLKTIKKFIDEKPISCDTMDELEQALSNLLDINLMVENRMDNFFINFKHIIARSSILAVILPWLYIFYSSSYRHRFYVLILTFALTCIIWEWLLLYQNALAEVESEIGKNFANCLEHGTPDTSFANTFFFWFSSGFSFAADQKTCADYFKLVYVNPIYKINPAEAMSNALAKSFSGPIVILANAFGLATKQFFSHLPLAWVPVFIIVVVILFCFIIIILCNYQISFLFGAFRIKRNEIPISPRVPVQDNPRRNEIEPSPRHPSEDNQNFREPLQIGRPRIAVNSEVRQRTIQRTQSLDRHRVHPI